MGPAADTVAQAGTEGRKQGGDQGRDFHRGGVPRAGGAGTTLAVGVEGGAGPSWD